MNKSRLTAQWWQSFLSGTQLASSPDVFFVRSKMIRPYQPEPEATNDHITQGKTIVFPVNNWISLARDSKLRTKERMIKTAKERMDSVINVKLTINDKEVSPERVMSPFFDLEITQKNLFYDFPQKLQLGIIESGNYTAISDGYWCFLKPAIGKYEINTHGQCATGVYTLAMNHRLVVTAAGHH